MKKKPAVRLTTRVRNGRLPMPRGLKLPDGTAVELIPLIPLPGDPPFLKALLKLARTRDWPRDFALNHGHYTKGHARK